MSVWVRTAAASYCRTEIRALFSFTGSSVPGNYMGGKTILSPRWLWQHQFYFSGQIRENRFWKFYNTLAASGFWNSWPHTGNIFQPKPYLLLTKHHCRNKNKRSTWLVGSWSYKGSSKEHSSLCCKCLMFCRAQRTTLFFRHKTVKHILPGPGEGCLSTHLRADTIHHRILAFGYQQLLAKPRKT